MNAKIMAEEILILMTYGFDLLAMPTFRKWDQSYEGWLYQNGLLGRIHYLEKQKFLEREGKGSDWVFRVTKAGRKRVCGGRDPEERWHRKWDGWWRLLVFDLPVHEQRSRSTLIRWLRQNGFGYLQDSVWITPDPVTDLAKNLQSHRDDAESFTLLESRCAPGFENASLVKGAWPFSKLQEQYRAYEHFASTTQKRLRKERLDPPQLFALLRAERSHWRAAFDLDPLLPKSLWPSEYGAPRAWESRMSLLKDITAHASPR